MDFGVSGDQILNFLFNNKKTLLIELIRIHDLTFFKPSLSIFYYFTMEGELQEKSQEEPITRLQGTVSMRTIARRGHAGDMGTDKLLIYLLAITKVGSSN